MALGSFKVPSAIHIKGRDYLHFINTRLSLCVDGLTGTKFAQPYREATLRPGVDRAQSAQYIQRSGCRFFFS